MPEPVLLPGFAYDDGKAEAMADALAATLAQARLADVTVPDQLAALGIMAARLIAGSRLRTTPQRATSAVAAFTIAWLTSRIPPAKAP